FLFIYMAAYCFRQVFLDRKTFRMVCEFFGIVKMHAEEFEKIFILCESLEINHARFPHRSFLHRSASLIFQLSHRLVRSRHSRLGIHPACSWSIPVHGTDPSHLPGGKSV